MEGTFENKNSLFTGVKMLGSEYNICKSSDQQQRFDETHHSNKSVDCMTRADGSFNIVQPIEFDSAITRITIKCEPLNEIPAPVENTYSLSVDHSKSDAGLAGTTKRPYVKCEPVEQLIPEDNLGGNGAISGFSGTSVVKEEPKCQRSPDGTIPQELYFTNSELPVSERSEDHIPVTCKIRHEQKSAEYNTNSLSSIQQSFLQKMVTDCNTKYLEKPTTEVVNSNEKMYRCTQCTYSATEQSILKSHIYTHSENKPHHKESACKTSRVNTSRKKCGLNGRKLYKCDQCTFTSNKSTNLKCHLRTHTRETPYKCEQCAYSASRLSHLKNHIRKHTGEKPYACDDCGFATSHRCTLVTHLRKHTGEKPHDCEYCDYKTTSLDSLKRHVRRHTGEKPYGCNLCAYRASGLNGLKTHMLTHTGVKPFKCDHCEYSATTSGNLKTHMRKHTGTPFKCEYCRYKTTVLNVLKTHIYKHTHEKPYKCEECNYGATTLSSLNRHMRSHTGGKPHKCDKCEHRASSKTNLKIHMQTHVNEKMHNCVQCEYRTKAFSSLKMHMRSHSEEFI